MSNTVYFLLFHNMKTQFPLKDKYFREINSIKKFIFTIDDASVYLCKTKHFCYLVCCSKTHCIKCNINFENIA